MDAQDDVLDLVIWVHGYLSGRHGLAAGGRSLSKGGLEKTIADIATVCKPDESKRFLDLVDQIK